MHTFLNPFAPSHSKKRQLAQASATFVVIAAYLAVSLWELIFDGESTFTKAVLLLIFAVDFAVEVYLARGIICLIRGRKQA